VNLHHVNVAVPKLIDSWCERRALSCLRHLLPSWPHNGLTDGVAGLKTALENVRPFARDELTDDEKIIVSRAIQALDTALAR
jgi:hypothetical protein